MASKNPYDAPVPRTLKADDATEVAMASNGTVLPVDDETNFGPLKGKNKSALAPEALAMDPRALAKKLAANAGRLPPTRTPTPRSRRLRPERPAVSLLEDEPTQLGGETTGFTNPPDGPKVSEVIEAPVVEAPEPEPAPPVDPRELARQLAAEAKRRIQQQASPAPAEDPAALARRLAAEAKARIQAEEQAAAAAETPAELAKRLAAEARARIAREAAERAATVPVTKDEGPPPDEPTVAQPSRGSGLAARAPRSRAPQSAQQALEALATPAPAPARVTRRNPAPEPVPEPPQPAAAPVHAERAPEVVPAPVPAPVISVPPTPSASVPPTPAYLAALLALLPTAIVERERPVLKHGVFKALWEAHQARAVKDNQLELAASATLLLARIQQRSPGDIMGIQLNHNGVAWAAFVDRTTTEVLAIVPRPAVYLAGLQ